MSGIVGQNLGRGSGLIKAGAIDDDSVTLAKMAGLARGKLIYGDASGDPAALAAGGAAEVLTHDGTDFAWAAAGGGVDGITDNSNANAITIDSSENVALDSGNLIISTAGKGIDFSADAAYSGMEAELLDDYEEGTWTPRIVAGATNIDSYTTQIGYYKKVGDICHIWIELRLNDMGSAGTGGLGIYDLPFTVEVTGIEHQGVIKFLALKADNTLITDGLFWDITGNNARSYIAYGVNKVAWVTAMQVSTYLDTGTIIRGSATFPVA